MSTPANSHSRTPEQAREESRKVTLSTLTERLAESPWGLAFASFAVTALLIRPDQLNLF